jgi:hypothetical protein
VSSTRLVVVVGMLAIGAPRAALAQSSPAEQQPGGRMGAAVQAVLRVGGGAVVGGFLGYFVSQVRRSDWERLPAAERNRSRQQYTLAGASIGAITGFFLRPHTQPALGVPTPLPVSPRVGRQRLLASELRRSLATNALEAVQMERPEWIRRTAGDADTVTSLSVFVDNERIGEMVVLQDIAIPELSELRYYDADDARRRWGAVHRGGAIEVVPLRAAPATGTVTGSALSPSPR